MFPCMSVAIQVSILHHQLLCHSRSIASKTQLSYMHDIISTCMSCTQYTPLLGRLVQSVAKTFLMCLQESALSDLIFPNDGSIL